MIGQCRSRGNLRLLLNTSIRWCNNTKADKYFMLSFLISSGQVVYFQAVSSHSERFFKIGVLKNFVKLTGKYLCRSLSLITQRQVCFFKTRLRHSCLLWILWTFWKQHFYRTTSDGYFCLYGTYLRDQCRKTHRFPLI